MNRFSPRITVATIIERDEKFLMVREEIQGELRYNQPAGHVEAGEQLSQAAFRETLEETAWQVEITAFVGVFIFQAGINGPIYHRYCFVGEPKSYDKKQRLDADIYDTQWLTFDEIKAARAQHRSPLVLPCLTQYLAGRRLPLDTLYEHPWPLQQK